MTLEGVKMEKELKRRIQELAEVLDIPPKSEDLDVLVAKMEKPEIKNRLRDHIKFIADYICHK
jgi:hypothetical protein